MLSTSFGFWIDNRSIRGNCDSSLGMNPQVVHGEAKKTGTVSVKDTVPAKINLMWKKSLSTLLLRETLRYGCRSVQAIH